MWGVSFPGYNDDTVSGHHFIGDEHRLYLLRSVDVSQHDRALKGRHVRTSAAVPGPPADVSHFPLKVLPGEDVQQRVQGAVQEGQVDWNLGGDVQSVVPLRLVQHLRIAEDVQEDDHLERTPAQQEQQRDGVHQHRGLPVIDVTEAGALSPLR